MSLCFFLSLSFCESRKTKWQSGPFMKKMDFVSNRKGLGGWMWVRWQTNPFLPRLLSPLCFWGFHFHLRFFFLLLLYCVFIYPMCLVLPYPILCVFLCLNFVYIFQRFWNLLAFSKTTLLSNHDGCVIVSSKISHKCYHFYFCYLVSIVV